MRRILCYGDSNTYGQIPGQGMRRYDETTRWPCLLQDALGKEYRIIEEGLSGRTTVWEDPIEEHRNGKTYLLPCLFSHMPLDLVILMLGTNDLKVRFGGLSSMDIADGVGNLIEKIRDPRFGRAGRSPEILLVAPAPLLSTPMLLELWGEAGIEKSHQLASWYAKKAEELNVHFFDAGSVVEVSPEDGLHYMPKGHRALADALHEKVLEISDFFID